MGVERDARRGSVLEGADHFEPRGGARRGDPSRPHGLIEVALLDPDEGPAIVRRDGEVRVERVARPSLELGAGGEAATGDALARARPVRREGSASRARPRCRAIRRRSVRGPPAGPGCRPRRGPGGSRIGGSRGTGRPRRPRRGRRPARRDPGHPRRRHRRRWPACAPARTTLRAGAAPGQAGPARRDAARSMPRPRRRERSPPGRPGPGRGRRRAATRPRAGRRRTPSSRTAGSVRRRRSRAAARSARLRRPRRGGEARAEVPVGPGREGDARAVPCRRLACDRPRDEALAPRTERQLRPRATAVQGADDLRLAPRRRRLRGRGGRQRRGEEEDSASRRAHGGW